MNIKKLFIVFVVVTSSCTQVWFPSEKPENKSPAITSPKETPAEKNFYDSQNNDSSPREENSTLSDYQPSAHSSERSTVNSLYNNPIYLLYENGLFVDCDKTQQNIIEVLGKPRAEKIRKLPNRHIPSQIDEIHELIYDGLSIFVYFFDNSEFTDYTSIVIGLTLTGQQYRLPENIGIGSRFNQVKEQLRPLIRSEDFFVYQNTLEDGYHEELRFYFSQNRLYKVVWLCPIN